MAAIYYVISIPPSLVSNTLVFDHGTDEQPNRNNEMLLSISKSDKIRHDMAVRVKSVDPGLG